MRFLLVIVSMLFSSAATLRAEDRADLVIADFEADDYGEWRAEGEAFGAGPARGTLANQMAVSGYEGKGLVNSYLGGDGTQGTLTSPPFKIERRYINFLVGGGHHPTETCIDLLVDGRVVDSATGPAAGGGNEHLEWHTFDVRQLADKEAVIQLVDRNTGGWGHVLVDQITQSDERLAAEPAMRELPITARYLNLPVRTGAAPRHVRLEVEGRTVRELDVELADAIKPEGKSVAAPLAMRPRIRPGALSLWAPVDLNEYRGKTLRIEVAALPKESQALELASLDDEPRVLAPVYHEKLRPQFHFTSRRGWLNDPNGLVYVAGKWHLFYQHNPYGWHWGNMHWGHAVSDDLIAWHELPLALTPHRYGDWCFSGSAVVDAENTSGFKKGDGDLLVLAYTSTGRGECIAYSNDEGLTWTEFEGNPVVRHQGRDPRLLGHAPSNRWVMAVYDETDGKRWIAFYTSADLKVWEFASRIEGFFECPDLFEIASDDDESLSRWVLHAADGKYVLGKFDGRVFTPETEKQQLWHGNFYAAQTYSNAPDGRRVQIGWAQGIAFPDMPFNQQMTIPVDLLLRATPAGPRLFAWPVDESESLRSMLHAFADIRVAPDENPLEDTSGELFDIEAEIDLGDVQECGFVIRGAPVTYNVERHEIACGAQKAPLAAEDNVIRLRLLADRGSIELFGNGGQMALSAAATLEADNRKLEFFVRGGRARVRSLTVYELRSAWK
ncbi:MAG TPA: glycoside hydrolase family 32 protein [Pirellulales bacterium]|nr:glycoside hydrolase family 32 protein [Pirellulales bacterium]